VPDPTAKSASNLPNGLVNDPIFLAFSDAGYTWRDMRPFETGDYPHSLHKRVYQELFGEKVRAYSIVVSVSNMFRIPGYPRDGSMPRFMFHATVSYQNVNAGIELGTFQSNWNVRSVEQAEKPAYFLWTALGHPTND
jgi:hypothetical protein